MHKCVNEVFNKTKPNKDLTHSFEISSQTSRPLVDCPTQLTLISHLWIFLFVRTNIKATNMKEIQQGNLLVSLRKLNTKLAKDCRVKTVMINIGDGYTLVTKL